MEVWAGVMLLADWQNETKLRESFDPHVTANFSIIGATQYPTLLLVEISTGVVAPELGLASTVFGGANYIAYFELTVEIVTNLHAMAVGRRCIVIS